MTYQPGFHNEELLQKMVYKPFGKTGLQVSILGFGGSSLALCYQTAQEEEGIQTVVDAVKSGINYIDTAPYYGEGKAEIVLGKALRRIPRDSYYIATKVGRYNADVSTMFDFSAARTLGSIEESLKKLGIDYVDILQVHDVEFAPNMDIIVQETLPALDKIKRMGKAKYIGITGYPLEKLKEVYDKSTVKIDLILSYSRGTLFDNALKEYIPYFKARGVGIINAAVLGMGLLTNIGPAEWHPATEELKTACQKAALYCRDRDVDITKLAVHYSLSLPSISTHLIGMSNHDVLTKNFDTVLNGLTLREKDVIEEIQNRFFLPLSLRNWENIEVESYWEKMKNKTLNKCKEY